MAHRKVVLAIGASVIAACGLAVALAAAPAKPAQQKPSAPSANSKKLGTLDVVEVVKMSFDISTTAMGEMKAKKQVELRNELESESTITEIVDEGGTVKKGDVLVKLSSEQIQQRLDEESLQLESARAAQVEAEQGYAIQVSENESALRASQLKLALAELDLQKWRQGEVESKRQELDHELDRTTKDELRLREKLDKSRELQSKGFYSLDQLKQDELAWEQAKAALAKADLAKIVYWQFEHPKDEKTKISAVEEAKAELDRTNHLNESRLASKDADRKNRQQALNIRDQSVTKYRKQIENSTIIAPQDGLVVYSTSLDGGMRWGGDDGPLHVGSKVYPNQTLIVLPDTSEMVAAVKVHESLASRIRPGQRATVKVDAVGDRRMTGVVEGVGVLAEQTSRWMDPNLREYTVRIIMDQSPEEELNSGTRLRPSMRCESEIMLGRVEDALTIPIQAVFNEGMMRYVHISDGSGRYTRRPVQLGQRSDRFAAINAGLAAGERVLLRKPDAGEVVNKPWDTQELAAVGLEIDERGQIAMIGRPGAGAPGAGGGPGGGGGGGAGHGGPGAGRRGGPAGAQPAAAPASADTAPAAKETAAAASPQTSSTSEAAATAPAPTTATESEKAPEPVKAGT